MSTDERRRAILEGAARLFRHYGQAKTTVADIAREADMGVGTFYLVFPSKEAIVEELSSSAHVRVLVAMREVAAARAFDSFAERLTGVVEVRVAKFLALAEEGQHACELVHCKTGPVNGVHARFRDEEAALLEELFAEARAKGEIAPVDIGRAVALVQRACATLSPPWLFELEAEEAKRTTYEMCRLLLLGLTRRHSSRDEAATTTKSDATRKSRRRSPAG
jgi:AcrR family transcriptional regulator